MCKNFCQTIYGGFSAFLATRADFKNCCDALTRKNQRIARLTGEAVKAHEKVPEHETVDVAAKTTFNGRKDRRATAVNKRLVTLQTQLVEAKTAHTLLVDIAAQPKADAQEAQENFQESGKRVGKV